MLDVLSVAVVHPSEDEGAAIVHRCGHGCVRCGVTITVFVSLVAHGEPVSNAPVALLCPTCFGLLAKSPTSLERFSILVERPVARDARFDRSRLPYYRGLPEMVAGGLAPVKATSIPLLIDGHPPLVLVPPITGFGATRFDVRLADAEGDQCHVVDRNFWKGEEGKWAFSSLPGRYVIESAQSESRLVLEFSAPDSLTVVHLLTTIEGKRIELTPKWLDIDGARIVGAIASNRVIGFEL